MAGKEDTNKVLAEKLDCTKKKAGELLSTVLDTVIQLTEETGNVTIPPHKFYMKHKAARVGRNPRTGEAIDIPAKSVIMYKTVKG